MKHIKKFENIDFDNIEQAINEEADPMLWTLAGFLVPFLGISAAVIVRAFKIMKEKKLKGLAGFNQAFKEAGGEFHEGIEKSRQNLG
jgi:hypothetical protein